MAKYIQRWALAVGAALVVVVMAAVPAAAQSAPTSDLLRQVCTGYAASQKCDNIDLSGAQNALAGYLQSAGQQNGGAGGASSGNVQQIGQQVQTIIQKLNAGNLPSSGNASGGSTTPVVQPVDPQAIQAQLQKLQTQAQQYLSQAGSAAGGGGTAQNPLSAPTPTTGQGGSSVDPAQVCQNLQDAIDKKIASLNGSAQDALARLDAAMVKLQAYQSTAGSTAAGDQQSLAAAQQAQASATQSVATLSTLSDKVDCSQSASSIAASLSTLKTSADSTKSQLQDFQKTLTQLINSLAAKAQS